MTTINPDELDEQESAIYEAGYIAGRAALARHLIVTLGLEVADQGTDSPDKTRGTV